MYYKDVEIKLATTSHMCDASTDFQLKRLSKLQHTIRNCHTHVYKISGDKNCIISIPQLHKAVWITYINHNKDKYICKIAQNKRFWVKTTYKLDVDNDHIFLFD